MSYRQACERVQRARTELERAEQDLKSEWWPWHSWLARYRSTLLIGSGLLSGFALARGSPRVWSRLGAAVFSGSAWVMRSPLGPMLLGALFASKKTQANEVKIKK